MKVGNVEENNKSREVEKLQSKIINCRNHSVADTVLPDKTLYSAGSATIKSCKFDCKYTALGRLFA